MEAKLIFIIGSPRSGSTLMQRMLGSHSEIFSCPEPHIITPLAHLGYFHTVEKAPYDHLRGVDAIRNFVAHLPSGETDYIAACRAYSDLLYSKRLQPSGKTYFLDKTPAYALVLDFLTRLYPRAKYIVLTRHPLAVFCSFANSFFDGDFHAANSYNPILNRYVPAIAGFIRESPAPFVHVRYESLVQHPQEEVRKICAFLKIAYEDTLVEYGKQQHDQSGLGDPVSVSRHSRPMTKSVHKWVGDVCSNPLRRDFAVGLIDSLDPRDLETWGYPYESIFDPVKSAAGDIHKSAPPPFDRFQLQRKLLLRLRRNIHHNAFGRIVKKIRFACDVLLR